MKSCCSNQTQQQHVFVIQRDRRSSAFGLRHFDLEKTKANADKMSIDARKHKKTQNVYPRLAENVPTAEF
jgi:hypothetical protein